MIDFKTNHNLKKVNYTSDIPQPNTSFTIFQKATFVEKNAVLEKTSFIWSHHWIEDIYSKHNLNKLPDASVFLYIFFNYLVKRSLNKLSAYKCCQDFSQVINNLHEKI